MADPCHARSEIGEVWETGVSASGLFAETSEGSERVRVIQLPTVNQDVAPVRGGARIREGRKMEHFHPVFPNSRIIELCTLLGVKGEPTDKKSLG